MSDKKIEVKELDLNDILPNRFQPRIKFNEDLISELSASIKEHGVIQPIIVRPIDDKYEIVAGERRFKASALVGLTTIPSIILNLEDKDSIEYALLENVQREDLSAIEEAITYKKIMDMGYTTQVQLAKKLGMSQSAIANKLRLLKLCDEVQEALMERKISERHARSLLKVSSYEKQKELLYKIIKEKMTVRQLDREISELPNEEIEDEKKFGGVIEQSNSVIEEENKSNNNLENNSDEEKISNNSLLSTEKNENIGNDLQEYSIKDETIIDLSDVLSEIFKPANNNLDVNNNSIINKEENDNMFTSDIKDDNVQSSGRFFDANIIEENDKEESVHRNDNDKYNKISTSSVFDFSSGRVTSTDNSSNSSIFTAKINDLLSPQGMNDNNGMNTKSISNENNADNQLSVNSEVERIDDDNKTSFFNNLLSKEENENDSNYLDRKTLNQFLDPTFVDGAKKDDDSENIQTNNPIFSKLTGEDNTDDSDKDLDETNSKLIEENNKFEIKKENSTSELKPDLLAPMESSSVDKFDTSISLEPKILNEETSVSLLNNDSTNQLTPDSTIDTQVNDEKQTEDENLFDSQSESNQESNVQPIFVNSSFDNDELSAPKNPIITNIEMSNLLSKPEEKMEETKVEVTPINEEIKDELPSTIAETAEIPTTNNNFMTSEDIQPIIITDYNKQYDPILPVSNTIATPTIDFKHIINLIRNLNNEIEGYGYKIDTEEIDLDDKYQVIFNIEKK